MQNMKDGWVNVGMQGYDVTSMLKSGNKLFVGTETSSVWSNTFSVSSVEYVKKIQTTSIIYPNPVRDELEIRLGKFTSSEHYRITDFLGFEMLSS